MARNVKWAQDRMDGVLRKSMFEFTPRCAMERLTADGRVEIVSAGTTLPGWTPVYMGQDGNGDKRKR